MDSMKASQYKEARRRLKYSGLYREISDDQKSAVVAAWDANTDSLKRAESLLAKGTEKHIDNILRAAGVDTAQVPVKKLYAHLNRGISFAKLVVILERSLSTHTEAVQVAEKLFTAVDRIPPVPQELHEQMLKTQAAYMPEKLKPNEAGFPAKEWVKARLRPMMQRPLAIAVQEHLKEVRALNDEAERRQNFLPDGSPAGIQHVLSERARLLTGNGRIQTMSTVESGGPHGPDTNPEVASRTEKDIHTLLERAATNPASLNFKEKLVVTALCDASTNLLLFVNSAGEKIEIECVPVAHGRGFKIRGGQNLEGAFVNADIQEQLATLWQSDAEYLRFSADLETKIAQIAPESPTEQGEIKTILQNDPWVHHFFRILTGETTASDIRPLLEGYKNGEQTPENKRTYAAITALAQAASFNELRDLFYLPTGARLELEDQKYWPNELKKILIEGKKYTNKNEKERVVALLDFPDGDHKKWSKFEYTITTEADGSRLYTRKSKRGALLTFRLTTAEQKQLRDTDHEISANPEKEIEGVRKALDEIKSRIARIERDSTNDALDAEKKARHIQYLDLLLKEEATFPGVYYEKPKPGEGTKDKRTKIQLLKIISADAVAISGSPIEGFSGDIPGIALNKAQLATWKAKLEGTTTRLEKPTGFDAALRALIATKDGEPFTGTPEERAILEKWTAEAKKPDGAVAGGFYKKTNATGAKRYDFASDVSGASIIFSITEAQVVKWDAIKVIKPKKTEDLTGRNAVIDQTLLADTATIDGGTWKAPYFIDDMPVEFKGDLAGRIGARMLDKHGVIPQDKVGIERARQYVKDCPRWKRWGIYIGLGALASLAAFGGGALYSAAFPFVAKSLTWWAGKVLAAGTAGIATTLLSRAAVNKIWKSKYDVSFFEHAKDAAGYEHALRMFKRGKKKFDASEAHRVARFNKYKAAGVPEAVAATYTAKMSDVMAWHEKGRRREQIKSMILPALGSLGTTGFIAYQYFPGFSGPSRAGTFVPNGPRGAGIQPTGRGAAVLQPGGRGPAFAPTGGQNAPVLVDRMVYNITCGYPNGIPVRAIIDGNTVNWYMNGFSPNMRVGCADGGLQYLLGSLDQVPRGSDTRRAISQLFNEALCRDPDLRDTFLNRGNRSSGKWFDYAVLKEYTWMNGRKQLMIDAMMERTNNPSVRSTLAAMKQSIMTGNMQLSVRR